MCKTKMIVHELQIFILLDNKRMKVRIMNIFRRKNKWDSKFSYVRSNNARDKRPNNNKQIFEGFQADHQTRWSIFGSSMLVLVDNSTLFWCTIFWGRVQNRKKMVLSRAILTIQTKRCIKCTCLHSPRNPQAGRKFFLIENFILL